MRAVEVWCEIGRREGYHPGPVRHHPDAGLSIPIEPHSHVFLSATENARVEDGDFAN